jgi:ATP-binding cassette subfamily C (CFTR/MRP) protein 5
MSFFDTTPLGRILNRFSRDMDECRLDVHTLSLHASTFFLLSLAVDSKLPPLVDCTMRTLVSLLLYVILISIIVPWVLVGVPVILCLFALFYSMFRVGTREFKRHQLISMSPLLSHVNATLEGHQSIKAYNQEQDFYIK